MFGLFGVCRNFVFDYPPFEPSVTTVEPSVTTTVPRDLPTYTTISRLTPPPDHLLPIGSERPLTRPAVPTGPASTHTTPTRLGIATGPASTHTTPTRLGIPIKPALTPTEHRRHISNGSSPSRPASAHSIAPPPGFEADNEPPLLLPRRRPGLANAQPRSFPHAAMNGQGRGQQRLWQPRFIGMGWGFDGAGSRGRGSPQRSPARGSRMFHSSPRR